jgi:succinyl-CoA synthetase beta subunit
MWARFPSTRDIENIFVYARIRIFAVANIREIVVARLDEHRGKQLLSAAGITVPAGGRAESPEAARAIADGLGGGCVVKALALVTGRAGRGWVRLVDTAEEVERHAAELLAQPEVRAVRVEQKLNIEREMFAAVLVDDRAAAPIVVLSSRGGSGIEQIAREYPESVARRTVSIRDGFAPYMGREMAAQAGITGPLAIEMGALLAKLYEAFRKNDCRSIEINPVVWTTDAKLIAADCHTTIDDYAVYRHPEMGIRMAREIGHDPSEREQLAYEVERNDYRGTFYFIELADPRTGDNFVAFHGAGGGGSMMSMDALMKEGFQPANFCDTSGNPPASKVYRAAKILLSQPHIAGYYASGSGVASQEQSQSARGLIKAFRELGLRVPAVIRLGGNQEELACELLHKYCAELDAPLEAYGKDDSARFCAQRLRALVDGFTPPIQPKPVQPISPDKMPSDAYRFATLTGTVSIDQSKWTPQGAQAAVESCPTEILKLDETSGKPCVVLAVTEAEAKKGKCIECLACELASFEHGCMALKIDLPLPDPKVDGGAGGAK